MKKTILTTLALIAFVFSLSAQTTSESRKREFGLRVSNINFNGSNTFDLVYKKQKKNNENKYRRYRLVFANISSPDFFADYANYTFDIGAAMGVERRKTLNDKFKFVHGPEIYFNYFGKRDETSLTINNYNSFGLSFGYILGVQYEINDRFCTNLETIPAIGNTTSINYTSGVSSSTDGTTLSSKFNIGMSSKAAISICYKF